LIEVDYAGKSAKRIGPGHWRRCQLLPGDARDILILGNLKWQGEKMNPARVTNDVFQAVFFESGFGSTYNRVGIVWPRQRCD